MAKPGPRSKRSNRVAPAAAPPMSHGPLFDAAARKRDAELLALVAASPDDATIAVYADWLEEQGDLPRATFLRTQQQISAMKISSPKLLDRGRALYDLGKTLDPAWIAAITRPELAGTAWSGHDDDGDLIWRFLPSGFVNYTQPSGTYENGRWDQVGITVALETNAHYADYFGVIIGDTMRGNAHNIVGHKWRWKVKRTDEPTIVIVPEHVNRTIHDDHVRHPPSHRTPRRTPASDVDAGQTPTKRTSTGRTAAKPKRTSTVAKTPMRRTPLARKKPLARRAPVRSKRH